MTTMRRYNTISDVAIGAVDLSQIPDQEPIALTNSSRYQVAIDVLRIVYETPLWDKVKHRVFVPEARFLDGSYGIAAITKTHIKQYQEWGDREIPVVHPDAVCVPEDDQNVYLPSSPQELTFQRAA